MSLPAVLAEFESPLAALQRLLNQFANQGVIIGGVAVSILAEPRYTADADAVILLNAEDLPRLLAVAKQEGFVPRIENAEQFARRNRVLLLQHTESAVNVDISLGVLPFEMEMVERAMLYQAGSLELPLPTPEDLIVMKAVAHRPKDILDIKAIVARYPKLDRQRIQFWIEQFAEALETPELWTDVAPLLRKAK